ncbi:HAD-IC family P-type ATPase [Microbacterium sp. zg.Y625]|uniref:HAD-IC family P-type ATPase n=1 Tax=Microbacterium jiangjiandongii TaxID=3049071 RepID=UPI00214B39D5|nr:MULTISPECIES: HAD-IC family P-type ATPase [unclassified Microbacterium]MCR2791653.1 HAD-IC family P-type ATPase [Microbacterium sp. zg.Y625]WIM24473.1 HAD-IC family P-type ATPase [Microbacterium sp. zg-Y625]
MDAGDRGLTAQDVQQRVAAGQTNAYREHTSRSAWSIIRANVLTLFNALVLSCFTLLLVIGRWQDALFGLSALANTVIGSVQEFRAKAALDRLALLSAPTARVRRDDAETTVAVDDVVLGDLLVLRAGDQIPADAEVSEAHDLQVDESLLTGESEPVDKAAGDRALSGSVIVEGAGLARVDRVGADSFANSLTDEAKRFSLVASELRSSIDRVLTWVTWIIFPVALLVLNSQMVARGGWAQAWQSGAWREAATSAIAAIIAMIPLGLVLMTSIAFAVGAVRLAGQQVLVQELAAVEGLARVDVICLDKTGTLTQGDVVFDASHPLAEVPGWKAVLGWYAAQPEANATARSLAGSFTEPREEAASDQVPFSSARKWSAVTFADGMWVMGAPEMVFAGAAPPDSDVGRMAAQAAELAARGRRTLVLARGTRTGDETVPADAVPVALLTFRERIRPDAAQTLSYFAAQDVAVRILSGDNPQTVAAIARDVGLDAPHGFDARQLPDDDDELARVLEQNVVFGRVTPDQKRRMVVALKAAGHTVAMTGDGVNDALAIKEADIGVAMNSGSAATKAVARLVLLDGKFSHLPAVVAEGRQVIANIERVSMLFLTKTAYATVLAITFGVLFLPFPFLPRQLSLTDGLTIGIPAFFLALIPNARRYIPGFLRRSLSFAVPAGIVVAAGIAVYTRVLAARGIPEIEVRAGATLVLGMLGLWILAVLARPLTLVTVGIVAAMIGGLALMYLVPISRDFFELVALSPTTMTAVAVTAGAGAALIAVVRLVQGRVIARDAGVGRRG